MEQFLFEGGRKDPYPKNPPGPGYLPGGGEAPVPEKTGGRRPSMSEKARGRGDSWRRKSRGARRTLDDRKKRGGRPPLPS